MAALGIIWADGVWDLAAWNTAIWAQAASPDDSTPDQFSFTDQSGVALSSTVTSAAVTITGIDVTVSFTASGGTIDVNSDGNFQTSRDVVNGDTIRARHTSSADYLTATNTLVTGGGVSDTFTSVTGADPAGSGKETNIHFGFGRRYGI